MSAISASGQELIARHGTPRYQTRTGETRECGMAVIALGKLGGQELNYSSDIDLMFVYTANGETDGPNPISNKEFYKKVANQYTHLLSTYTAEGLCYRVDLRLRPDGSLGEVCISLDGARKYYQSRARDWELQMMIKARVAAGDRETGRDLLDFVEPLIYSTTLDFSAVEAVSATRERISEKLSQRRGPSPLFDVKLARGGIRDIEFLVQCLQRLHGGRVPWVRHGGTMLALSPLERQRPAFGGGILAAGLGLPVPAQPGTPAAIRGRSPDPHSADRPRSWICLRANACALTWAALLPARSCCRKLNAHLESVQEIYERVIHAQKPIYYSCAASSAEAGRCSSSLEPPSSNLVRFLDQKRPHLAEQLAAQHAPLGRARRSSTFWKRSSRDPALAGPAERWQPDGRPSCPRYLRTQPVPFRRTDSHARTSSKISQLIGDAGTTGSYSPKSDPAAERFRRSAALFPPRDVSDPGGQPVFGRRRFSIRWPAPPNSPTPPSLAAYRMAVEQVLAAHPPSEPLYPVANQMMVVALGRLGMREFDLSSDADLIFMSPMRIRAEHVFWTRVANRMIDIITAYTGAGLMFAVDTRLAPEWRRGRAGAVAKVVQGLFRQKRRGLGRHRVHEIPRRGGRSGARDALSERTAGTRLAALRPERPLEKRSAPDAHAARKGAGPNNPLKAGWAAFTISISRCSTCG